MMNGSAHTQGALRHEQRDPLDAVPVPTPGIGTRDTAKGGVSLSAEAKAASRIGRFCAEKLGMRRTVQFALDERGAFFWRQVDGTRPLSAIERALRARYSLDEAESKAAVIAFTKTLMLRGLISLRVDN